MLDETTIERRMAALGIQHADLEENFILGWGSGGQKINKTSSCVQLIHRPSGIEIKCQQTRSRAQNRLLARSELCDRIEARREAERLARRNAREKERRRNRPRSTAQKRRMLNDKRRHAEKKSTRRKIDPHHA